MKLNKKLLILTNIAFFILAGTVYASSSQFLSQSQKYINTNCSKKQLDNETALLCYLFNKVQEHDTSIANINTTISPIPSEITDLQKRVSALETQIPTPTPTPETFTFFNGSISTSGQTSPTVDTQGYSKIAVSFQCTVGSVAVNVQDSPDQNTWFTQESWDQSYCPGGVTTQLVLANRYYRLITDSTTLSSVSLNATGYIFHQ
ncbi:MAG: hypothetical protein ACXVKK_10450 [Flavisolibacter sp.]